MKRRAVVCPWSYDNGVCRRRPCGRVLLIVTDSSATVSDGRYPPAWRLAIEGFLLPGSVQRRFGPACLGDTVLALTMLWWAVVAAVARGLVLTPEVLLSAVLDPTWGPGLMSIFVLFAAFWGVLAVVTAVQI